MMSKISFAFCLSVSENHARSNEVPFENGYRRDMVQIYFRINYNRHNRNFYAYVFYLNQ